MKCVNGCNSYRHEGPCPDLCECEGCGFPLEAGQDRYCEACALEMAQIDAEQALRRFEQAVERKANHVQR
jgi:hypothetical protein